MKHIILLSIIPIIYISCSNSIEQVNSIIQIDSMPLLLSKNVELKRTQHGKIILKAFTKEIQYKVKNNDTIILFPKGIFVQTYTTYPQIESMIKANYAKYYSSKHLWEVKNNVLAINYKNDTLTTELLYWDEKQQKIYSNKYSRISTSDGILIGRNGFEADENMTRWKVINTQGTVNVKDE